MEDIIANDRVKVLDDCLFCIHLQRQYSAARELEEFVKAKKDDNVDDTHAAKYFQALKVRYYDNCTQNITYGFSTCCREGPITKTD